jgi:hypothetical protein
MAKATLKENVVWEARIRKSDLGEKSEKEINEMIVELNLAFQAICWAHGLHN